VVSSDRYVGEQYGKSLERAVRQPSCTVALQERKPKKINQIDQGVKAVAAMQMRTQEPVICTSPDQINQCFSCRDMIYSAVKNPGNSLENNN